MANVIHVDVVEPGCALITHSNHSGRVSREDDGRYRVEDTDSEQYVCHVRSYRAAGQRFARHHGIADCDVVVEHE